MQLMRRTAKFEFYKVIIANFTYLRTFFLDRGACELTKSGKPRNQRQYVIQQETIYFCV